MNILHIALNRNDGFVAAYSYYPARADSSRRSGVWATAR